MIKLPTKIEELNIYLKELSDKPCFDNAQQAINSIVGLLGIDAKEEWKLFSDSQGKIRSNAPWFMEAQGFADKRASYKIAENANKNIDLKVYWMQNLSKSIIGWLVALTPNFEDEDFYGKLNIGIDFVIPEKADRIMVILSKNYIIRTLELTESLSVTQQEIFHKWIQDFDFENKKQVHNTLWQSFDLEPVNKGFYKGISSFFVELQQHLSENIKIFDQKHAAYFTNRLIGRIVFCWFLDKKGIINKDIGYFDIGSLNSSDYYHTKLETLFFKVFNTQIEERGKAADKTTPFLNGGLFEAKENDRLGDIDLTFPKDYFDRLYKFLKHYNFTTDESTSTFQQVAIDPEMLGRIFENLLAEQVEETGEQARKAKGAFYTPREIVDYMCKESLREYLKTKIPETAERDQRISQLLDSKPHEYRDQQRNYKRDLAPYKKDIIEALDNIKVIDPACGSGAFPMGMMQLLLMCYERLEPRFNPYVTKLEIMKNNLYGVDIEPMAVEISRLRAWLSIIVDEGADSKRIEPLPNLDFKFICANSLIPLKRNTAELFDTVNEKELLEIRDKYFNARTNKSKDQLRKKYETLIGYKQTKDMFSSEYEQQLKSYHPFDTENVSQFFDSEFMFGVKVFDIAIGNPPYGVKIYDEIKKAHQLDNRDSYGIFISMSISRLLKPGAILIYIVSDTWLTIKTHLKLREQVLHKKLHKVIRLHQNCFEAMVNACIFLLTNEPPKENFITAFDLTNITTRGDISELREKLYCYNKFINQSTSMFGIYKYKQKLINMHSNLPIFVANPELFKLFNRFTSHLIDIAQPEQGIGTGDNTYYLRKDRDARGKYKIINPENILKEKDINSFNDTEKLNGIDPIDYRGRYFLEYDKGGHSDTKTNWLPQYFVRTGYYINWSKESVSRLFNATIAQCKERRVKEEASSEQIRPQDDTIRAAWLPEPENWFKTGITFSRTGQYAPTFRMKCRGPFDNKSDAIITDDVFFLLGILNSKLIKFFAKNFLCHTVQFEKDFVAEIPIADPTNHKDKIKQLVCTIIDKQKNDSRYDYMVNEQKEIDSLIYHMYNLNNSDIQEVETWYMRRYPKLAKFTDVKQGGRDDG
jgi:hypothetical protein